MQSYRFDQLKSLDDLAIHIENQPEPQRGEVVVKIHAVALNRRDLMIVEGTYPGPTTPGLIPCSDAAGEITAVGEGVTFFKQGDRVVSTYHPRWFAGRPPLTAGMETYGNCQDGWLCEYKVVSQEAVVHLPHTFTWEESATLTCAGVTAWNAINGAEQIKCGQTVLTLGTGSVSIFAIQLAKLAGARVISTTSSDTKTDMLLKLGADHVVNYNEHQNWGKLIRDELTDGVGIDLALDVVGSSAMSNLLDAVRWGGEIVLIGQLSNKTAPYDTALIKKTGARIRSVGVGHRQMLEDLTLAISANKVRPLIAKVFPFAQSSDAFEELNNGLIGKIVIKLVE